MKLSNWLWGALLLSPAAFSGDESPQDFEERLRGFLGADFALESIAESPMSGVYEISAGGRIYYAAIEDDFLLLGSMFDLERGVNLGERKQNAIIGERAREVVETIPVEDMVVFRGEASKRHITVFTDVDCGYCRRLHREVPVLNEAGIDVRYVAYPVITERSHPKAVSVWCAADQQTEMTRAKNGAEMPPRVCDNPVDEQLEAGRRIGISGTPFIVIDDYEVIAGYMPAANLIEKLGLGGE